MDTQTQIERLIELAIVQRTELRELVEQLPTLREHLNAEIERTFEEAEPQIRTELEEFCRARATDEHAKTGAALAAKVEELSKQLEVTTAAKYSVLMAERAENVNLLAKAEARIEDAASMLSHAVKEIVTDELSRFPRAGEIDQLRKEFAEPKGLNPRGRWMPDETYRRLDLVTINGDSFVSNIDGNRERPSRTAGDWTLSAARGNGGGGGGVTTMTDLVPVPTDGQLLIGNGAAFVNATLTAGTGISISNGPGSITINATDGNITLDDGTAAAPSLNFTNEPTTGLFRASANVMGFAVNGTSRATMTTTGLTVTGTITPSGSVHAAAGSVGNPSLAFNADQDTGLFGIGANNIGVAAGGAKVLDIATTGLGVTGTLSVSGVATLGTGAILNTPASGTLTNATGLPISTGVSGLGTGVATFLATPSSANLLAAVTNETGTGALVFGTSPTLTTPISASLTSPASTNLTLAGGTAGSDSVVVSNTLAASSAIIGAFKVGNGTAATNVAIGGGDINAGGTGTFGSSITVNGAGSGAGQIGILSTILGTSTGTNNLRSLYGKITTATAVYNVGNGYVLHTDTPTIGVGSSITSHHGLRVENQGAAGITNAYGIDIAAQSGASTTNLGLRSAGIVSITNSTAGASNAGALVVAGGISAGNTGSAASYFGGAVTVAGLINSSSVNSAVKATDGTVVTKIQSLSVGDPNVGYVGTESNHTLKIITNNTARLNIDAAGAATFAGAVTAAVVTSTGAGYTNSGFQITNTSASRTIGFFLYNTGITTIRDVTGATDLFAITTSGNATFVGTISPQQATTAAAPAYVKGAIYFDTTLNKLRVGGATAWETITSV